MRRRSIAPLGETEMEVLQHVWALGEATVADVLDRITAQRPVAYTTVMTVMKKLATKGFLDFAADGQTYVYSPARPPEEVRQQILQDLLDKVFRGSPAALVQTLVGNEALDPDELERIRAVVQALGEEEEP